MTVELPRWMMRDPAKAYERIEEMQQARARRESRSKRGSGKFGLEDLRRLFEASKAERGES